MSETWKPIDGYPKYEVSDTGRVRSFWFTRGTTEPRILRPAADPKGYLHVRLSNDEGARTFKVHPLVARAFLGPRPQGLQVRHLDGNNQNNRVSNLAYGTQLENMADRVALKTRCKNDHPFTPENTRPRASGGRVCLTCQRDADLRRRRKQRGAAA